MGEAPRLSALQKNLLVLEKAAGGGTFSQIVRETGLPVATAHRILGELVENGWLTQGANRGYGAGRRAHQFAAILRDDSQLAIASAPLLAQLSAQTGMTAHLGVIEGDEVVYVSKVDAPRPYRMNSRVGAGVPLYSTSIGKAALATMGDEEVRMFVERTGILPMTDKTVADAGELIAELAVIRERGWALDDGENEAGLRCIGAAVFRGDGRAIGGVSITGLEHEVADEQLDDLARQVQETAKQISMALGHQ